MGKKVEIQDKVSNYENSKINRKQKLVRSEFKTIGKYNMPNIYKQNIYIDEIDLLCYIKSRSKDEVNKNKTLHFFTYDWNFDEVYDNPEKKLEVLKQYYALLTPDFSMYFDMPLALQIYSTFKNRWCGAYWQSLGLKVIPTVEWGTEDSFDFCFDGIEEGCVVAVSTYSRKSYEREFMFGYNKMLEKIKPEGIICYGEPFKGMKGNVKFISPYDYQDIISKIGKEEFLRRYFEGDLYPSR